MDIATALSFLREFLLLILVFGALLAYSVVRGKRALISLILGLYIALLVSLNFPYSERLYAFAGEGERAQAIAAIVLFALFAVLGSFLFERLLSYEYEESAFEGISKKALVAALGTMLVFAYSYHVLPVTTLIDPGSSISFIFAPEEYFFWMLIIPLVGLFLL